MSPPSVSYAPDALGGWESSLLMGSVFLPTASRVHMTMDLLCLDWDLPPPIKNTQISIK